MVVQGSEWPPVVCAFLACCPNWDLVSEVEVGMASELGV